MNPSLLILTKRFTIYEKCKFIIYKLLGFPFILSSKIYGHPAVTRSLVDGLSKLGIPATYNPPFVSKTFDFCIVPCTPEVVVHAIQLKKRGLIRRLIVGPNISVRSNENNGLLAKPEIDVCVVPSNWVKKAYIEDEPSLKNRLRVWYAGVDESFWKPCNTITSNNKILIYCKTDDLKLCAKAEQVVQKCGFTPIRIKYGQYNKETYRKILSEVQFSIFLSSSESQGIALAESWSMNVPTLVLRANENQMISGKLFTNVSSAPYLNKSVGDFWDNTKDLISLLTSNKKYQPRKWILKNMTDEVSAKKLINICHADYGGKL